MCSFKTLRVSRGMVGGVQRTQYNLENELLFALKNMNVKP